jgi:hypothetical protein
MRQFDAVAAATQDTAMATQVHAICAELDALDNEIAALLAQVAELPNVLAALAGHPVLWLLLGREGIDRAGNLGAIVGQQVVTSSRVDRRALVLAGMVMLVLGLAVGVCLGVWYGGGI